MLILEHAAASDIKQNSIRIAICNYSDLLIVWFFKIWVKLTAEIRQMGEDTLRVTSSTIHNSYTTVEYKTMIS